MQFEIECPSGAVLQFCEIGGPQIIAIAERVGANASSETLTMILGGCCKAVVDPGPYAHLLAGGKLPDWTKMLYGDVMTALLWLRVKSFPEVGQFYDYEFNCEHCKEVSHASQDLLFLLNNPDSNKRLPEDSAEALLGNQWLSAVIPARYAPLPEGAPEGTVQALLAEEIRATFDLHRIAQDAPMKVEMKRANRKKVTIYEQVATQLKSVDGLVTAKLGEPVKDLKGLWGWAQKQSADTVDNLLAQMRAADCGVDPVVLAWCENEECGRQSKITLPFGKSFFNPRAGGMKKASTMKPDSSESSSPA